MTGSPFKLVRLAALLAMLLAEVALAAPPRFTEEDLSPPPGRAPVGAERLPAGALVNGRDQLPARATAAPAIAASGDLSYTVRPGESLGVIAQLFHVNLNELARANRLRLDDPLAVGVVLKIPNPYAAQVRELQAQLRQVRDQFEQTRRHSERSDDQIRSLRSQFDELSATAAALKHDVAILPWWRDAATAAGAGALVLLGLSALALVDWYVLRRRFRIVVDMNESLRRLDHKYKATLAKAELRFQQLYGRRRLGSADLQLTGRIAEDYEIERLNQELKAILEQHVERLGSGPRGRRKWLRPSASEAPASAEVRPSRR